MCKVTDFGLSYQNFKYGHGNAKKVGYIIDGFPFTLFSVNLFDVLSLTRKCNAVFSLGLYANKVDGT